MAESETAALPMPCNPASKNLAQSIPSMRSNPLHVHSTNSNNLQSSSTDALSQSGGVVKCSTPSAPLSSPSSQEAEADGQPTVQTCSRFQDKTETPKLPVSVPAVGQCKDARKSAKGVYGGVWEERWVVGGSGVWVWVGGWGGVVLWGGGGGGVCWRGEGGGIMDCLFFSTLVRSNKPYFLTFDDGAFAHAGSEGDVPRTFTASTVCGAAGDAAPCPFQREERTFGATGLLPKKGKLKLASLRALGSISRFANVKDKESTFDGEWP